MRDQLALYTLPEGQVESFLQGQYMIDRDLTQVLERRGRFVGDLFLDEGSIGDLLGPLTPIMGAPLDGLLGRSDMGIPPLGPSIYTSHVKDGEFKLILKTIGEASRLLGRAPGDDARAKRLHDYVATIGGANAARSGLRQITRLLERARNTPGQARFAVYSSW